MDTSLSKLQELMMDREVCYHPVCLIYALSTSREMSDWMLTSWNQDRWEKHQQSQICGYHSNGRKLRETKEPLDEGEGGQ